MYKGEHKGEKLGILIKAAAGPGRARALRSVSGARWGKRLSCAL